MIPALAHVGSADVYYEGDAGPYHLFVTVRMPQVIPGVAEIEVRCESGDVKAVQIVPLRLSGPGSNFPPTPDLAVASKEDPQFFTGSLWLMESGALQVRIMADGANGKGELSVPVASFAQRTYPMEKPLAGVMIVLMLVLGIGVDFNCRRGRARSKFGARRDSGTLRHTQSQDRDGGDNCFGGWTCLSGESLVESGRRKLPEPGEFLQAADRRDHA